MLITIRKRVTKSFATLAQVATVGQRLHLPSRILKLTSSTSILAASTFHSARTLAALAFPSVALVLQQWEQQTDHNKKGLVWVLSSQPDDRSFKIALLAQSLWCPRQGGGILQSKIPTVGRHLKKIEQALFSLGSYDVRPCVTTFSTTLGMYNQ